MKKLNQFIIEKFRLSKDNLNKQQRDLSNTDISKVKQLMRFKTPREENMNWVKMEQYFNKKSNPQRLVNSIKDDRKLVFRWYICVINGYSDYYPTFREAIVERDICTEDQLDAYILFKYNSAYAGSAYGGNSTYAKGIRERLEEYLDTYDVKYDKK